MSWTGGQQLSVDDLLDMLSDVVWERDPNIWDGIAGKITPTGMLSLAGGVKDNGSKTASALEDSNSDAFYKVRGRAA
jgi:hypothetical protein